MNRFQSDFFTKNRLNVFETVRSGPYEQNDKKSATGIIVTKLIIFGICQKITHNRFRRKRLYLAVNRIVVINKSFSVLIYFFFQIFLSKKNTQPIRKKKYF